MTLLVTASCAGSGSDGGTTSSTGAAAGRPVARPTAAPGQVIVANRLLVGWWDGTTWQAADPNRREPGDPEVPLVLGSQYTFVSIDGRPVLRVLGASTSECIGPGPVYVDVPDDVARMVGVAGGVHLLPRPVEQISDAPAHRDSVRAWLVSEGVENPEVSIDRVTRTDLEGDGVDEVFIEASHLANDSLLGAPAGDYSVVLLRHVVAGGVETVLVRGDVVTEGEATPPNDLIGGLLRTSDLVAIADLDGDTWLEVVVATAYYEGSGVAVYTWDGSAVEEVAAAGCGA